MICPICEIEFEPHPRTKNRQMTCGKMRCSQENWNRRHPEKRRESARRLQNARYRDDPVWRENLKRKRRIANYTKMGLDDPVAVNVAYEAAEWCEGCVRHRSEVVEFHVHHIGKRWWIVCEDCNLSSGKARDDDRTLLRLAAMKLGLDLNEPLSIVGVRA